MKRCLAAGFLALCVSTAAHASGGTTCRASATAINFGTYVTFNASPTDSTGTLTLSCTPNNTTPVEVSLDSGLNGGGNIANRKMASGANRLSYQLYSNSGRTNVWPDGQHGSNGISFTSPTTATVFARIPAKQAVAFGTYSDTITVTVDF